MKWALISVVAALLLRLGNSALGPLFGCPFQPQGFLPFYVMMLLFAAGEETGWRGYALPRLMRRSSPLTAAFLLGVPWALLHAPLTLPGKFMEGMPVVAVIIQMMALSILGVSWFKTVAACAYSAP